MIAKVDKEGPRQRFGEQVGKLLLRGHVFRGVNVTAHEIAQVEGLAHDVLCLLKRDGIVGHVYSRFGVKSEGRGSTELDEKVDAERTDVAPLTRGQGSGDVFGFSRGVSNRALEPTPPCNEGPVHKDQASRGGETFRPAGVGIDGGWDVGIGSQCQSQAARALEVSKDSLEGGVVDACRVGYKARQDRRCECEVETMATGSGSNIALDVSYKCIYLTCG